jgi:hypothetical protein
MKDNRLARLFDDAMNVLHEIRAAGGNKKGNPCGRDLGRYDYKKLE